MLSLNFQALWYRRWDLNPYSQREPDFESSASAIPPLRHTDFVNIDLKTRFVKPFRREKRQKPRTTAMERCFSPFAKQFECRARFAAGDAHPGKARYTPKCKASSLFRRRAFEPCAQPDGTEIRPAHRAVLGAVKTGLARLRHGAFAVLARPVGVEREIELLDRKSVV